MASENVWSSNHHDDEDLLINDSDSDLEIDNVGPDYDSQGFVQKSHKIESDVSSASSKPVSGTIGSASSGAGGSSSSSGPAPPPAYTSRSNLMDSAFQQTTGGRVETRRFMGGDTLDEPVTATLLRDLRGVGFRLRQVIWYSPATSIREARGLGPESAGGFGYDPEAAERARALLQQDWDLWGPLVFCLLISVAMSMLAPNHQASQVFAGVFVLLWAGQAIVTLNIRLLGGNILFFHAMCVTGYCLFPIVIASILSAFVGSRIIRIIVDTILVAWAIYSATMGLKESGVLPSRVFLAMYPVGLLYTGLGWLCVIT